MTRKEKKEELIGLFSVGAICIGDLIDECFEFGSHHPRWISVEDELPPLNQDVLVVFAANQVNEVGIDRIIQNIEDNGYEDWELFTGITHWMQLPSIEGIRGNQGGISPNYIIGNEEHIKVALDVINKKGG